MQTTTSFSFLADRRHENCGVPVQTQPSASNVVNKDKDAAGDWRMRERLKTVSVALALCLNIGIEPPDQLKTSPCAKLECWVDPLSLPQQKGLETIGKNLQQQYEVWQPRARYKPLLDPSVEETKKTCLSLRKNAKEERILFHYNGHGVPKPTKGGEIWVFNKSYTQYLPCSIYDIQSWLGSPCIYVFDCSNAGNILNAFGTFAAQHDIDAAAKGKETEVGLLPSLLNDNILLAACGATECLPMNPDLPADLFTCCLTTPIEIALRWFVSQNSLLEGITADMIMKIPGQLNDRRTPLGELNWIFTAITDTIAWNMFPHEMFKKLFRQDLMVAALFRNFLLAERIMRYYNCTPMSLPELPPTHQHFLWSAWDLAAELCLHQLPGLLKSPPLPYQHSTFFSEQLTAFEVWLSKGPVARSHPEQLPIVLQVLLSQVHRLRALMLLSRFLDLGPWSVKLALSVGIFPYVLKLLQSPAAELKPVLVFIWAKILALDSSCQNDLLKDNGFTYFINILASVNSTSLIPNMSEHRAMCAFILSVFCHNFKFGQDACVKNDLLNTLALHLDDSDPLLRQWVCICIGKSLEGFAAGLDSCINEGLHERIVALLSDSSAEVRSSAVFAISRMVQGGSDGKHQTLLDACVCNVLVTTLSDSSPLVRKETVILLSGIVQAELDSFIQVSLSLLLEERYAVFTKGEQTSAGSASPSPSQKHVSRRFEFLGSVYKCLLTLSVDPFPLVSKLGSHVVDLIHAEVFARHEGDLRALVAASTNRRSAPATLIVPQLPRRTSSVHSDINSVSSNSPGGMKRSSSFVNPFKGLQGLASLVSFPATGSALATADSRDGQAIIRTNSARGYYDKISISDSGSAPPHLSVETLVSYHIQNGNNGKPMAALKSFFYEWSLEYFREPQMKVPDIDDPGSTQFNQKLWRHQQNEKYTSSSILKSQDSSALKFDHQVNFLHSDNNPGTLLYFHPFEPHLLGADNADGVIVYNWEDGTKLNWFSNGNPDRSRITSLRFINENDVALVVVGSGGEKFFGINTDPGADDGMVRIYRDYHAMGSRDVVSAWRAVNENLPTIPKADLLTEWHQDSGTLLVAGDLRVIRLWDLERELCVQDIGTKCQQAVTSITIERKDGNLIIGGFADGSVNLYDKRVPSRDSLVMSLREHSRRVLNCKLQSETGSSKELLVTGSTSGDVRLWDIFGGGTKSLRTINAVPAGVEMTALAIHEEAPLFACGTNTEYIRIFNINGLNLNTIRYNDGFLGSRIGRVGCLAFHRFRDILAAGTSDNASLSLFSTQR